MPIRSKVISKLQLVVSEARGSLTLDDITGHRSTVLADPRFNRRFGLLFDLRRVLCFDTTADEMRIHAAAGRELGPRYSRIAILAPSDLAYTVARIYETCVEGEYDHNTLRVYRDQHAAWRWLLEGRNPQPTVVYPPQWNRNRCMGA